MFTNLIVLVLILLLIGISPGIAPSFFSPFSGFFWGLASYALLLALLIWQAHKKTKLPFFFRRHEQLWINAELFLFLILFHMGFGSLRIFNAFWWLQPWQTIPALFSLLLYFGGIATYYYFSFDRTRLLPYSHVKNAWENASSHLRLIAPFTLPFLIFTFILDLANFLPDSILIWNITLLILVLAGFALIVIILLPYFIQKVWQCRPLENKTLETALEQICRRANFKHGGIKTWTIIDGSLTAAIIGVLPSLRYIIFTKRILKEFPQESLEAILAHEIGHSYHKHLWIFPLIFLGMMVFIALASLLLMYPLLAYLFAPNDLAITPMTEIFPLLSFIFYALLIVFYFRIIFGYFSRLFERQADLHVFHLGLSPDSLIRALDLIGISTGYSHNVPNWHHHSLQDRINFLLKCKEDPSQIQKHHNKVKMSLLFFLILLYAASSYLFFYLN